MPNLLDMVTQDDSDDGLTPFERAITIRPLTDEVHALPSASNQLVQAVAPEVPNELTAGLARLAEYIKSIPVGEGQNLLGDSPEGRPRYQLWPERMVRSGLTLPGDVASGAEPIVDPATGRTSGTVIQRAMDTAGLAGGSTLFAKPGAGTLGSGAMRPEMKLLSETLAEQIALSEGKNWKILTPEQQANLVRRAEIHINQRGDDAFSDFKAPVFYSALEHATTNAAQDTMLPQQWLGYLKNQPGVKAEELAWTGIGDWLGQQKGKVNKKDVQAYLDENKVEIKDVTKGGASRESIEDGGDHAYMAVLEQYKQDHPGLDWDGPNSARTWSRFDDWYEGAEGQRALEEFAPGGGTKYESYQLPGGDNYREHLLTMPEIDKTQALEAYHAANRDRVTRSVREPDEAERTAWQRVQNLSSPDYRSSHWDEPNVLAHVRTNDRYMPREERGTDLVQQVQSQKTKRLGEIDKRLTEMRDEYIKNPVPSPVRKKLDDEYVKIINERDALRDSDPAKMALEGATKPLKSLHIEEIQSDWHQQGRKQGYKDQAIENERARLVQQRQMLIDKYGKDVFDQSALDRFPNNLTAAAELKKYWDDKQGVWDHNTHAVPDAPFKTSWPELALKRMIRKAAEEGYDRISWTPGEAQAARYDLSKQIKSVQATPNIGKEKGTFSLDAIDNNDKYVSLNARAKPEELANIVGKDLAEKIVKQEGAEPKKYESLDLKVGGEGMREFYDKMLPKMVEKIGKAHGVKVKQTKIQAPNEGPVSGETVMTELGIPAAKQNAHWRGLTQEQRNQLFDDYRKKTSGHDVHYFDLPQSLKDHAIGKGFPLYMSGVPFPLTPVDHDPFADKQLRKSSQKAVMQEIDPGKDWGGRDRNALEPSDVQRSRTHGRAFQQEKP